MIFVVVCVCVCTMNLFEIQVISNMECNSENVRENTLNSL
jgi:hypothetical protein